MLFSLPSVNPSAAPWLPYQVSLMHLRGDHLTRRAPSAEASQLWGCSAPRTAQRLSSLPSDSCTQASPGPLQALHTWCSFCLSNSPLSWPGRPFPTPGVSTSVSPPLTALSLLPLLLLQSIYHRWDYLLVCIQDQREQRLLSCGSPASTQPAEKHLTH